MREMKSCAARSCKERHRCCSRSGLVKSKHATPWMQDMLERKPPKLVAIALANKIARIAWKLMLTGENYQNKAALPAMATAAKEISLQRCA